MDPLSLKTKACKWNSHHSADPKSILIINSGKQKEEITRLHSSRMRTGRLLTVSPSMFCSRGRGAWSRGGASSGVVGVPGLGGWGACSRGGACSGGCLVLGGYLVPGGACSRGAWSQGGGIQACTEADPSL